MFPLDGCDQVVLYKAHQRDFETAVEKHRLLQMASRNEIVSPLRQRIGSLLIALGRKVAQEPHKDAHLVLSARH